MIEFFFTVHPDGAIIADVNNPAVSTDLLKEILHWKVENCGDKDIITRLRQRTVPSGYQYTTWSPGTKLSLNNLS